MIGWSAPFLQLVNLNRKSDKLPSERWLFKYFYEREEDKFTQRYFHILVVWKELKEDSIRVSFYEKEFNEPQKDVKLDSEI